MTSRTHRSALVRDHHIPMRRQLAADLEAGIRDGHVPGGSRLPSSRDLARHLAVDRSTVGAALARLRRRGLVETGPGCRSRVAPHPPESFVDGASRVVESFQTAQTTLSQGLARAYAGGLSREAVLDELGTLVRRSRAQPAQPMATLYEPRHMLRAVLAAELTHACGLEVDAIDHPGLAPIAGPLVVRRELMPRLRWLHDRLERVPISLAGGTRERGFVRRRVRSGLVVLLTKSETIRHHASELAVREVRRGISFAAIDPDDPSGAVRAVSAARLVFYDRLSERYIRPRGPEAIRIRVLAPRDVTSLRRYFGTSNGRADRQSGRCGS